MIWFVGAFVVNLLHFHGDGRCYYPIKWAVRITVGSAALILWVLSLMHLISSDYGYSVGIAWLGFEPTYSMWRRYRERAAKSGKQTA